MKQKNLSIIVPTFNEESNVERLVMSIDKALHVHNISYEIVFIDDRSIDKTSIIIETLAKKYPIKLYIKTLDDKPGKAYSLLIGFKKAKYDIVGMIDADLQYPPEALPAMLSKILKKECDVVVAERVDSQTSLLRTVMSKIFRYIFGKSLHGLDVDVQSGLKVFKKEIIERVSIDPTPWSFDLEFLIQAQHAGYTIGSYTINFDKRQGDQAKVNIISSSIEIATNAIKLKFKQPQIIPLHPSQIEKEGNGFHYRGKKFNPHSELAHHESAIEVLMNEQRIAIFLILCILALALTLNAHLTAVVIIAFLTILYFIDLLFNLYLIVRSFSRTPEITVTADAISLINPTEWPTYTIFCPLYKEWEVLPQFVTAMSKLDYPKDKLQVMLLLEEDDKVTQLKARSYNLPSYIEIVVVPHSLPKTKPKACNYGLKFATGEYCVIYDAEDVPDIDQLKKTVVAFQKTDQKTACIQAKLNYYNPHQNVLTRVFTAEYSLWFDLVLTGLQSINAPIPLGGTSNHFKVKTLQEMQGWDAFNVTEDCDLGMRLVKRGYHTAIVDSTTLEEANSDLKNWFWQRSRWIKGYMQTYLVHMRRPSEFMHNWKEMHLVTFQLVVGGKILSLFVNPLMWIITITYFTARAWAGPTIETFFPTPILYMGTFSLIFGNFLYLYYYMIGCAKREHYSIIKYVFLVPFYWLCMSMAAWLALYKLITAPHQWSKTKHGLHLQNKKAVEQSKSKIGRDLVDKNFSEDLSVITS